MPHIIRMKFFVGLLFLLYIPICPLFHLPYRLKKKKEFVASKPSAPAAIPQRCTLKGFRMEKNQGTDLR